MKQETAYIYALTDPFTSEIRYVGKSIAPRKRLRGHIIAARNHAYDHHTSRWIRKLLEAGAEPIMKILEAVPPEDDWRESERAWVKAFEESGARLTNSTAGGEGLDYRNPEDKARYIENLRRSMEAYRATPEGKEQMRRMIAGSQTPESRAKRSQSLRETYAAPEMKDKMSKVTSEINSRPEVKAKRSKSSIEMWKNPEVRKKFEAANADPEVSKKKSDAKKKLWADPESAARLRALYSSDERRAKLSAVFTEIRADAEYKDLMRDRTSAAWADPKKRAARQAGMDALKADTERNAARVEKMRAKSVAAWSDPEAKARRLEKLRDPEVVAKKKAALRAKWADPEWRAQREANAARRKAERLAAQPKPPL